MDKPQEKKRKRNITLRSNYSENYWAVEYEEVDLEADDLLYMANFCKYCNARATLEDDIKHKEDCQREMFHPQKVINMNDEIEELKLRVRELEDRNEELEAKLNGNKPKIIKATVQRKEKRSKLVTPENSKPIYICRDCAEDSDIPSGIVHLESCSLRGK